MNQSKLKVNTCSTCDAEEKMHELVVIGFGFTSDWIENGRVFEAIV